MRPPFQLTPGVNAWCAKIERLIGRSEGLGNLKPTPQLRRENRIRTVQATTAIEGNTLSMEQVTAVLEGKRVRGPAREIAEVKNALAAYDLVAKLDPHAERDLLRAHGVLLAGLADDAGRYRRGNVGIITHSRVTHVAPPAARVPGLMQDLFAFLKGADEISALIRACVFHYELEFIHPFSDGNGRIGRLWQHAILCAYSPALAHVPTESLVKQHQQAYYAALARSDKAGDATAFILFMLEQLHAALTHSLSAFRPTRVDQEARLRSASEHFGKRTFSRKDYLGLHSQIAQATASRDLRAGVEDGALQMQGEKATARYRFRRAPARVAQ